MINEQLVAVNNQIILEFSKTLEMFDLTPAEARLFATLYLEEKPMTLDQMSEALGKSKTSVNTGIRNLLELKLVERVWKKGVRKDLYKVDENLYRNFINSFISKRLDTVHLQKTALINVETQIGQKSSNLDSSNQTIENSLDKLKELIVFHQSVETLLREVMNLKKSK